MDESDSRAMGIRVAPTGVEWVVVAGQQDDPAWVDGGHVQAPAHAQDEASALQWYRRMFRDLIDQHQVATVGVRYAEQAGPGRKVEPDRRRARIEGVILEAAADLGRVTVTGAWNSISSRLGTAKAKEYLDAGEVRGLDVSGLKKEAKEAAVVAVSALPKESG